MALPIPGIPGLSKSSVDAGTIGDSESGSGDVVIGGNNSRQSPTMYAAYVAIAAIAGFFLYDRFIKGR